MESPLVTSLNEERGVIPSPLASPKKTEHCSLLLKVLISDVMTYIWKVYLMSVY